MRLILDRIEVRIETYLELGFHSCSGFKVIKLLLRDDGGLVPYL